MIDPHDADNTVFDGVRFSEGELERAAAVGKELGLHLPAAHLAAILRRGSTASDRSPPPDSATQIVAPAEHQSGERAATRKNFAGQNSAVKIRPVSLSPVAATEKLSPEFSLKSDRKEALKIQINRLANSLARQLDIEFGEVHRFWKRHLDGASQSDATEEDLRKKFRWLVDCRRRNSLKEVSKMNADRKDFPKNFSPSPVRP